MTNPDLRKLTPSALQEKREQVIRLKEKGYSGKQIQELTLVNENQVSRIWRGYVAVGAKALKPKKRGRKLGDGKRLSAEQEKEIRNIIIDKKTEQMKLNFMLWTRQSIHELVMNNYHYNDHYAKGRESYKIIE